MHVQVGDYLPQPNLAEALQQPGMECPLTLDANYSSLALVRSSTRGYHYSLPPGATGPAGTDAMAHASEVWFRRQEPPGSLAGIQMPKFALAYESLSVRAVHMHV